MDFLIVVSHVMESLSVNLSAYKKPECVALH